ncbi:hypothetical protein [Metabacillus litoralis]|uniref:hypothetical protein n=1 Tax=Metabacillus litoralis TaxID=152268 RepID=UPI001CFC76DD|nr:hypothetical protein [Metabacillus litoralis]
MGNCYCLPRYQYMYYENQVPINYIPQYFVSNHYNLKTNRQFPDVDSTLLEKSAKAMRNLMKEASIVLNKLADSKTFANKVMYAAQQSNMDEVNRLIQSTGIKSIVKTSFTPDGINMKLSSSYDNIECCHLTIALRWL